MSAPNLQDQIKHLDSIIKLIYETREQEQTLTEHIKQERDAATKVRSSAIESFDQKIAELKAAAEDTRTATIAKIEERRELEPEVLKDKHDQRIVEINVQAEDISEQTENKLNEAIWLSESVYEGAIPIPRRKAKDAQEALDIANERLLELKSEAPKTLSKLRQSATATPSGDVELEGSSVEEYVQGAATALEDIQSDPKAKWFVGFRPHFIVAIVTIAGVAIGGTYTGWQMTPPMFAISIGTMAFTIIALIVTFASGSNSVRKKNKLFAKYVNAATQQYKHDMEFIDQSRRSEEKGITANRDVETRRAEKKYRPRLEEIDRLLKKDLDKEVVRFALVEQKLKDKIEEDTVTAQNTYKETMASLDTKDQNTRGEIQNSFDGKMASLLEEEQSTTKQLQDRWNDELGSYVTETKSQAQTVEGNHPAWSEDWSSWNPSTEATPAIPIGTCEIDLQKIAGELPEGDMFKYKDEPPLSLPICTSLPEAASLLITTDGSKRDDAISVLQSTMMRCLTSIPPGKAKFTLIDPVGLGQSFAGVLHLADFEESQLLDRAWTEPRHIETQLARLTEHMETVIQKYLRNEFESIDEYNKQAGEIAEPYRFLVIADLPNNFSENASKRLASIITSGARCGVYVIIHQDKSIPLPSGIDNATLARIAVRITEEDGTMVVDEDVLKNVPLTLEQPPSESATTTIVKKVGETADDTHRVEVPFQMIAPRTEEIWSMSTTNKVVIPLGRSGATKLQNLTLGRGTAQHALIAGKTGSGKSTLLHVLITNLALWYSPDEVEFYLVDFKKGVEFKTYATHKLPHARVVAVESDREFGISVLQRIDAELKRRGELFRKLGVQDIAGFREKCDDVLPRILLIIDEFQEFFIDDDQVAQEANLLLDRLVRQGRAFGIHAIMGSQTLDGAYTLSRSTMGQMAVRVALQCSEQDSYIILNEDNAAARLLSRPGEAIYNDAAGKVEGNSPFQVVWLDEKLREELLGQLTSRDDGVHREMVVYEGNQPVHLRDNHAFTSSSNVEKPPAAKAWLGGAMAIKEDTSAIFRQASASNLLFVGQQEATITSMIGSTLLSLDAQYPAGTAEFLLFDGTPADSMYFSHLTQTADSMTNTVKQVGPRDVEQAMASLNETLVTRMEGDLKNQPSIYICINQLHRFRDLRRDEDDYGFSVSGEDKQMTPAQILAEILKEGPPVGMHVITASDTLANLNRTFDRQSLREFDMRVLLQMGSNDSTNLIDAPNASKLGMHRALFYSEETGTIEPFRPYAISDAVAPA